MADTNQPSEPGRLKDVRLIGLAALEVVDRGTQSIRDAHGDGSHMVEQLLIANTRRVGDEEIDRLLRSNDATYPKLIAVAERASALAVEIEAPTLPEGWTMRETLSVRSYSFQGGNAQVTVNKETDQHAMNIKVFGANTWAGYEGSAVGYVPLRDALIRAQETLADPSSHLSPYGVKMVEDAKAEHDKSRDEVVSTMRANAQQWSETAERHQGVLLGERFIVLDRHDRAYSHVHVDGEAKSKLALPDPSLIGVSMLTKEGAEQVRAHLETAAAESAPFVVWDFQQYAQRQAAQSTELGDLAAAAKWTSGREAKTLKEGKELAEVAITRLGLPKPKEWRGSNAITPWEYTDLELGGGKVLTIGASSGGVVSLNGKPHTPDNRKVNVTLAAVVESMGKAAGMHFRSLAIALNNNPNVHWSQSPYAVKAQAEYEAEQRTIDPLDERDYFPPDWVAQANVKGKEVYMAQKFDDMNGPQRKFVERLEEDCKLPHDMAVAVTGKLGGLAAMHLKLAEMDLKDGLTEPQKAAQEAIENEIRDDVRGLSGMKDVSFLYDPRGTTVGVHFESGAYDSFNGSWKVPLAVGALKELESDFWEKYVPEPAASADDRSGYVVLSITETGNAAFVDVGRDYEMARIIEGAAASVGSASDVADVDFFLRDINGNTVGKVEYTETVPTGEPDEGTVRLSVDTGNAAFEGSATEEVARILREAADKVKDGEHIFVLRDYNGNTVGKFEYREEPSLEKDGVIDMNEALNSGRVYLGEDGFSGIADGEYRYVVTTADFEPGYGQGEGEVWLVNAKGEIAAGYEEPQLVRETLFRELKRDEKSDLRAVAEGRVSFEDFERRFSGEEPELG
jgi:hypothetical protein